MLNQDLLPAPPVIRERLARTYREARILRSLLRLSYKAVAERIDHRSIFGVDPSPDGPTIPPESIVAHGGKVQPYRPETAPANPPEPRPVEGGDV